MVDDAILAVIVGAFTLFGAVLGLFAEPVRARFARKEHQKQLRKTLYGELFIKFEKVLKGSLVDYQAAITLKDINSFNSPDKEEFGGLTSFFDEVTAEKQYYQLKPKEFHLLAVAYYRLRRTINLVNKFGPFKTVEDAKKDLKEEIEEQIRSSFKFINDAFEENADALEKSDCGSLLKKWRKLVEDFPQYSGPRKNEKEFLKKEFLEMEKKKKGGELPEDEEAATEQVAKPP